MDGLFGRLRGFGRVRITVNPAIQCLLLKLGLEGNLYTIAMEVRSRISYISRGGGGVSTEAALVKAKEEKKWRRVLTDRFEDKTFISTLETRKTLWNSGPSHEKNDVDISQCPVCFSSSPVSPLFLFWIYFSCSSWLITTSHPNFTYDFSNCIYKFYRKKLIACFRQIILEGGTKLSPYGESCDNVAITAPHLRDH